MNNASNLYSNIWPSHSDFAQRWLARFPHWECDGYQEAHLLSMTQRLLEPAKACSDEASLMKALRLARQRLMIEIIKRDLLGQVELFEVTEALSFLADSCVQIALSFSHKMQADKFGQPANGDCLMVVGMGKLGGLELNASSDIDLIFLYNSETETSGAPNGRSQSHSEFFTQVGRRLIRLLSDVTEDGFVFRVDMRLRPNGDSGPLACSLDMLEEYFVVQGREWERYAWIKSRVLNWAVDDSQDEAFRQALDALHHIVRPFVYRKYLDFGAIRALRSLHQQIRAEVTKRETQHRAGLHVKLGRGGIREIEFIAQAFQLIRGGREPQLQLRRTVDVLQKCHDQDLMTESDLHRLCGAYYFLRNLEHRLQYIDDAQTHRLPTNPTQLLKVARSLGFEDPAAFLKVLKTHMDFVAEHFDTVFGDKHDADTMLDLSLPWPEALTHGFSDPEVAQNRYSQWINSARYKTLPEAHVERVNRLMPALLIAARQSESPDHCWRYCCNLIETISRRGAYLSLLDEYPLARLRVSRILANSHWAADFLIKHPILLDELLDSRTLLAEPDLTQWAEDLRLSLSMAKTPSGDPDQERQMDLLREQHHAQLFRILAQDLEGLLTVEAVSDLLSGLADQTLKVVMELAWRQLAKRHIDEPKFAVVAYGKLGGKELGYASDLDLIFLYDDAHDDAPQNYSKLAQRMNRLLSTQTAAGTLFETDFRLRPNGEAGLLVTSFEAFEAYQRREGGVGAWFWEYQALTRARFCIGDAMLGEAFERLRRSLLALPRSWHDVRDEVVEMRKKMAEGHPNHTELFDVKHDAGGMVDIEFMVQAIILGHAHAHPTLTQNAGNIALLKRAAEYQLIPSELAQLVADAYRKLRAKQHALRLAGFEKSRTADPTILTLRKPVRALWKHLFED